MFEGARVAVVIPAFDEGRWIEETLATLPAFVDHAIVVDDASRDETAAIARRQADARVLVVTHATNRGVGAAIVTGYRQALALGADVVAVMAGDGQMHPDDLGPLLAPVVAGRADYAKGNRLAHPSALRSMPLPRLVGTAALAWLTRHAAGLDQLSDSQCGFTAISAGALRTLGGDLDRLWPRYGYPNDLLGALARRRQRVAEVVVRPVYRGEASGLKARHVVRICFLIARIAAARAMIPY